MKKTNCIFYLVIALVIFSCENVQRPEIVCSCAEKERVLEFVTDNIKAANNMSDEEMEDIIRQLEKTGVKIICHKEMLWQSKGGIIDWEINKLDSCQTFYNY